MTAFTLRKELLGRPIEMRLTPLDRGVHILLTGGQSSHVGAVALAEGGRAVAAASYPGHREREVAEHWAAVLSAAWQTPVTVACGIHYDNATRPQIDAVLAVCDGLLAETLQITEKSGEDNEV